MSVSERAVLRDLRRGESVNRAWAPEAVSSLARRGVVEVVRGGWVRRVPRLLRDVGGQYVRTTREVRTFAAALLAAAPPPTAAEVAEATGLSMPVAREAVRRTAAGAPDRWVDADELALFLLRR